MLRLKLLRDLWRSRGQISAIVLVVALGCTIFTASYLSYQNLRNSYAATESRVHLADLTVDASSVSDAQARQAAAIQGVAAAEAQLQMDLPITVAAGVDQEGRRGPVHAVGRLLSIPLGGQPQLNQLVIQAGQYPTQADQVLVERHFATYQSLHPGDSIQIDLPGGPTTLKVSGVAVSAEYLWVTRSRQDVFPSPAEFGVLFVPRPELTTLARAALSVMPPVSGTSPVDFQTAQLQLAADPQGGNRLLCALQPGANVADVKSKITSILGSATVLAITPRADLTGVQLLQLDVDGFRELAVAFPLLFLIVGGFIIAALLYRRVDSERPVIGTLLALGTRPATILLYYVAFAGCIGVLGAVLGTGIGIALADALTTDYAQELSIPFVTTSIDPLVIVVGIAIGIFAPLLAGVFPAQRAAGLAPATAMRPFMSGGNVGLSQPGAVARRLPFWLRVPMRNIRRHPWRSAATAFGVGAAILLIVTTGGMLDSTQRGIDLTFNQSQRFDLRVDVFQLESADQLRQRAGALNGVSTVETLISLPVQVRVPGGAQSYTTDLQGLPNPSPLLSPLDSSGNPLLPSAGRAVLSRSIASKLNVSVGDRLEVSLLPAGPTQTVTIGALSDDLLGNSVTLTSADAETLFGLKGKATTMLLRVAPDQRQQVKLALENSSNIAQVTDLPTLRAQLVTLMGLANLFLGVMLLFGVALAAAILFNTAILSIAERQREFATMRALGERMSGIVRLVTVEHVLIALVGLVVSFPIALFSLKLFLGLYSSDLFSLPFWISPRTSFVTILGVLLVLLVAQWPALRTIARTNLAEAVKLRE